jgi:probable F420-dependent oxidoreductase
MKFGLIMPQCGAFASRENIATMARAAEDSRFDSVWVIDHIVMSHEFVERFSSRVYEAFVTLGYLAGITERVRLGTTVLVLPYRHPIMLAKQIASLDRLSGGRVDVGVGFGWLKEEFEALDVPYERRGRRADEMIAVFDRLWSDGSNAFEGEFYQFPDFEFEPKPLQRPRPPIWVGGNNERAIERVVRYGDAWHPITSAKRRGSVQWALPDLECRLAYLDELAAGAGRDPGAIARTLCMPIAFDLDPKPFLGDGFGLVGSADDIRRNLEVCRRLGIEHVVITPWYTIPGRIHDAGIERAMDTVERFANEVMPEFADPA